MSDPSRLVSDRAYAIARARKPALWAPGEPVMKSVTASAVRFIGAL